jgi:hypothetical protein
MAPREFVWQLSVSSNCTDALCVSYQIGLFGQLGAETSWSEGAREGIGGTVTPVGAVAIVPAAPTTAISTTTSTSITSACSDCSALPGKTA